MNPKDFQQGIAGVVRQQPRGYWAFMPNPLPPTFQWSGELINTLSEADRSLGQLAGLAKNVVNPNLLIKPFVRREAILSSRIEGTRATIDDLYRFESGQLTLFELPDDVKEVDNYVKALHYGLDRLESFPMSLRFIRELHEILLTGVRGEQWTPGQFRTSQNWIGGFGSNLQTATYVPPPPTDMEQALFALEEYIHVPNGLPPLIRLALIHYQFEAIHPFLDGNGRIGRLLINILLYSWDLLPFPLLYLSAYFNDNRQQYYDHLLSVSKAGTWEEWLSFFLEGVRLQSIESVTSIGRLQALQAKYREAINSGKLWPYIDFLFEQPVFTTSQLAEKFSINFTTARRYVNQLESKNLVREITGRERNRVYQAHEIIEALL